MFFYVAVCICHRYCHMCDLSVFGESCSNMFPPNRKQKNRHQNPASCQRYILRTKPVCKIPMKVFQTAVAVVEKKHTTVTIWPFWKKCRAFKENPFQTRFWVLEEFPKMSNPLWERPEFKLHPKDEGVWWNQYLLPSIFALMGSSFSFHIGKIQY